MHGCLVAFAAAPSPIHCCTCCLPYALQAVPWVLLWVWSLDVFVMFVPAIGNLRGPAYGGLAEQLTGICCDHLLLYTFGYLWYKEKDPALKKVYWTGGIAAFMHMLEIVPLGESHFDHDSVMV